MYERLQFILEESEIKVALLSLIEASIVRVPDSTRMSVEVRIGSRSVLDVFVVLVGSWMLLISYFTEDVCLGSVKKIYIYIADYYYLI